MNLVIKKTLNFVLGNIFLFLFLSLMFLHMWILGSHIDIYNDKNFQEKQQLNYAILTLLTSDPQKIPENNLKEIISAINASQLRAGRLHIILSLSEKPTFKTTWNKVTDDTFLAPKKLQNSLSFPIKKNLWLNCKMVPTYSLYETLIYLVLLDFLVLGLYLFYVFSLHRFAEPLESLKNSAEKLGIDLNTPPEKTFGPKIVRETASAMHQLQIRIKNLISTRTQMLATVSHDLRTYITRLKLRLHLLPASERLDKITEDLNDMELMLEDVLNFSGEDILKEKKVYFDIAVLLYSVCEDLMDQGLPIHIQSNTNHIVFFGCRVAFKRMFINLTQNALKYANEVWVNVHCELKTIQIIIEDNGPGIPEAELQKVLEPFYRSAETRERHIGFGLGLTIAHEVVKFHNGKITITNRDNGGLRVTIVLVRSELEQIYSPPLESLSEP